MQKSLQEIVRRTCGRDTLIASGGNNELFAGSGNDILQATGGNNYLDAGDGADTLIAHGGGNTLYGGAGNDTLFAFGGNNTVICTFFLRARGEAANDMDGRMAA